MANTFFVTPLVHASIIGNLSKVQCLVEEDQHNVDERSSIFKNNKMFAIKGSALHAAVINGQMQVVNDLVHHCKVNIEKHYSYDDVDQRSLIWWRNNRYSIHGTALHAAVINGRVQVVNYLLTDGKANINAKAQSVFEDDPDGGSTALHLAVSNLRRGDKQKKIVKCLLTHGADWAIVNEHGKQCWETIRNAELTIKCLIELGVGCDSSRNAKSLNIAHSWAKSLHPRSAKVISFAIDKGINFCEPDNEGSTPLMRAAVGVRGQPNVEVVELILNQTVVPISLFERITAFELMGATLISNGNFDEGLQRMKMAMELRTNNELPIHKPSLTDDIKMAFNVTSEVNNMTELESIAHDLDLLQVQAHLIRLRILGLDHSDTLRCLESHAFRIYSSKPQTFMNYLHLILKGIGSPKQSSRLAIDCSRLINRSLLVLTQNSDNSTTPAKVSTFNNAMHILRKLISHLDNDSSPLTINFILDAIVNLTHVMLHGKPLTSQESTDLKCCLRQAVRLRKRNTDGLDLFLLACSESYVFDLDEYNSYSTFHFRRRPSARTISIFIEVGADVDSVTKEGDTALHVLAKETTSFECMLSFEMLYRAGVHMGQTNLQGKTMFDILHDRNIRYFYPASICPACLLLPPPLKCLCAPLVPKNPIFLLKHIPGLSECVMRHMMHYKCI